MHTLSLYMLLLCLPASPLPLVVRDSNASSSKESSATTNTTKFVFAHHIIGNTFNFTPSTWNSDVALASSSGIDAFALNIGNEDWEPARVQAAYDAAANSSTNFRMFLSLDMSSLPCSSVSDAQRLVSLVQSQASHPSQFRYGPKNKAFVSTFSGESCTFSAASPSEGWARYFVAPLASEIHFVPAFFIDPRQLSNGDAQGKGGFADITEGYFNWNSGWPSHLTTVALTEAASNPSALASLLNLNMSSFSAILSSPNPLSSLTDHVSLSSRRSLSDLLAELTSIFGSPGSITDAARATFKGVAGSFTTDEQYLSAIQNRSVFSAGSGSPVASIIGESDNVAGSLPVDKTYMAAVSPWFFTHYSPQSYNKNFIFLSDNHIYAKRWETLVAARDAVDVVEIATWNDYGESHYIGPIEGVQPDSQAWVNGNDHTGWLVLTAYYAQAFKTGVYPAIERERVVMWARTHPRDADASHDTVNKPTNFELTEDTLWATVLTPTASTVTLTTSPDLTNTSRSSSQQTGANSSSVTFQIPAGVSHIKAPLTPGGGMHATISRGGQTILDFAPEGYVFNPSPETFNFNAFVAASP